jgi:hypothetical protein
MAARKSALTRRDSDDAAILATSWGLSGAEIPACEPVASFGRSSPIQRPFSTHFCCSLRADDLSPGRTLGLIGDATRQPPAICEAEHATTRSSGLASHLRSSARQP